MWIFWVVFFIFFISGWRLILNWKNRTVNAGVYHPQDQPHFAHEIEEVIEDDNPNGDPPSLVDPPCSFASSEFYSANQQTWNPRIYSLIPGVGGLIVGYMTTVTGGLIAIPNYLVLISRAINKNRVKSYKDDFCTYRNQWLFLYSSVIPFMVVFGIILASFFIHWGRRNVLRSSAILLLFGMSAMAWFPNVYVEVISLLFTGFGVGLIHQVTRTIYIEAVPKDSTWEIFDWGAIVGSIIAVATNYMAFHFRVWGWKISLVMAEIPSLFLLITSFFLIESPQYLIERNQLEKAKNTLKAMRATDIEVEFLELVVSIERKQSNNALRDIFSRPNCLALIITTLEMIFGSISGVEVLIFYGPFLLQSIYPMNNVAFIAPLVVALIQAMAKGVGVLFMHRMGRRRTFVPAYLGLIISLVCLAVVFHLNPKKKHHLKYHPVAISIAVVVLQKLSNGILLGPYGWMDSRFPEDCGDVGSTYTYCLGLFTTFAANQISLRLLCGLREWTFLFYARCSLLMMGFTFRIHSRNHRN